MVRTASTAIRASGGKSAKAVGKSSSSSHNASSSGSNEKSGGSGNPVHPRETPTWQKPISNFFKKSDHKSAAKSNVDVDMKNVDVVATSTSSITTRDIAEAGSSKDIYKLRNVHIDNNNEDEAGSSNNNNNNGYYNNNNNNNVLDHNNRRSNDTMNDNATAGSSNESMDVDGSNPGTSGYRAESKEDEATFSAKDKENLDDNSQSKKRVQDQLVVDNPPKKLKPEFYKYLEEFESVDR